MRPRALVVLEPARQHATAVRGTVIRSDIGPLQQCHLDSALGFAVGARGIGPCAAVADMEGPARGAKTVGAVARAIVGQDASDPDTPGAKPPQGATQEATDSEAEFIRQQLDVRHPRM